MYTDATAQACAGKPTITYPAISAAVRLLLPPSKSEKLKDPMQAGLSLHVEPNERCT